MCARRPTSAMPKSFLCCERAFCRSMVVMFCALKWSVLMSWCLLRGQVMWWSRHLMRCDGLCCVMSRDAMRCHGDELYYSSTSLYYKPWTTKYYSLLQYYSVLQSTTPILLRTTDTILYYSSTTPVLPCTTKYYSSTTKYYSSTNLYYKVVHCTTLFYKVLLQYYSVLQSTTPILLRTTNTSLYTPVLPCTTKYYSSSTLYYKVLLQYYSVLQILLCTTPVLHCTTKYYSNTTLCYSSTTLHYKVLLQYYPVLQSTTPVLLQYYSVLQILLQYYPVLQSTTQVLQSTTPVLPCTTKYYSSTTKYYSSTTLYYKVLLQKYYSVLQSTAPVQLVLQSTTPVLTCTTKYYSSTTLFYKVLLKYYSVLLQYYLVLQSTTPVQLVVQSTTPVLTCTTKYYSSMTLHYKVLVQYYSVLQSTLDWFALHMKRHLQCAEQQKAASNFSKYCACHAKWISWLICIAYETSFTMRGATKGSLQLQQILRLPRKMNFMIHDWSASHMKRHLQCAEQQKAASNFSKYCTCHAKWISWLICIAYETSFTMRRATVNTLQPHQILRLPRKMNLMIDLHRIWNVIYNARSSKRQPPTSANTAPATQNESHDWSASHMKRHLQCAEQQSTPSNLTKYCPCHAKWPPNIWQKFAENSWNVISNARPIREWSDHDPSMIRPWSDPENAKLNPPRRQGYFSHSPGADSIENYNVSRSGYHSKFRHMLRLPRKVTHELHQMLRLPREVTHELHQMLRLPRKVTHELHQMLHVPRKMNLMIDPHHIWNVIYNARSNSQHPPTSPNIAPATQNDHPTSDRNLLKTAETWTKFTKTWLKELRIQTDWIFHFLW